MATTPTQLARAAASTTAGTTVVAAVPSNTTYIVTNVVVSNTSASAQTFTLNFGGVAFISGASIAANSVATFDIKQVLTATQTITGNASATSVIFHIAGVVIV